MPEKDSAAEFRFPAAVNNLVPDILPPEHWSNRVDWSTDPRLAYTKGLLDGFDRGYAVGHAAGAEDCIAHRGQARLLFRDGDSERVTPDGRPVPGALNQIDRRRGFDRGEYELCRECWQWWHPGGADVHRCPERVTR